MSAIMNITLGKYMTLNDLFSSGPGATLNAPVRLQELNQSAPRTG